MIVLLIRSNAVFSASRDHQRMIDVGVKSVLHGSKVTRSIHTAIH